MELSDNNLCTKLFKEKHVNQILHLFIPYNTELSNKLIDKKQIFKAKSIIFPTNLLFQQIIDLIPNGSKIPVTNENKLQYLDHLAQYRLANAVRDQIDSFLKGLNELIPDNLLSIFDENELEVSKEELH